VMSREYHQWVYSRYIELYGDSSLKR
jgi:hypothetical protein